MLGSAISLPAPLRARCTPVLGALVLALGALVEHQLQVYSWYDRAYFPFPRNYLERLELLRGWNSTKRGGLNCSGFLANAHSESFRTSYDFYYNQHQDLTLLQELEDRGQIDESLLRPGDFAAFEGPDFAPRSGIHVAAYVGNGTWIDGDGRRGYVEFYHLKDVPRGDFFFTGHVRLYRWKHDPPFSLWNAATSIGKDNTFATN